MGLIGDWFNLENDRPSFRPRLPEDAHFIFCHDDVLQANLIPAIEMSFATDDPVKMLIYGGWGVGKTHMVEHLRWWFGQHEDNFPVFPVIIELGDITKKSRFDDVVAPFLNQLGIEFLIELVNDFKSVEQNVTGALREANISPSVAEAFQKVLLTAPGLTPIELVRQAFDYLKGQKPRSGSGFDSPLLQSREFVDVLGAIGVMYQAVHQHRILFIADEAAKLEAVETDDASLGHWVSANRLIFDDLNTNFGFIYTVSAREDELPRAIFDLQVRNRIGEDRRFELRTLALDDVKAYLRKLFDEFIDFGKVEDLVKAGKIDPDKYSRSDYPFKPSAFTDFVEYWSRDSQNAKPRDITQKLDKLAFLAAKSQKRLIDDDSLKQAEL